MEVTEMSIERWIDKKMWYIYTMEYYSVIKNNDIMPFVATKDGPNDYYTKWNKGDRDKYCISLICGIKFLWMINMNLFIKQKQTLKTNVFIKGEI